LVEDALLPAVGVDGEAVLGGEPTADVLGELRLAGGDRLGLHSPGHGPVPRGEVQLVGTPRGEHGIERGNELVAGERQETAGAVDGGRMGERLACAVDDRLAVDGTHRGDLMRHRTP
jgi:hypothetical protein